MNLPLKVAQAKVGPSSPGEAPRVISLTKPQDNQSVVNFGQDLIGRPLAFTVSQPDLSGFAPEGQSVGISSMDEDRLLDGSPGEPSPASHAGDDLEGAATGELGVS